MSTVDYQQYIANDECFSNSLGRQGEYGLHYPSNDTDDGAVVTNLRLVHPTGGVSIRTITTGTKVHATGESTSYRFRRVHRWEGHTEELLDKHDEVVITVGNSKPQPFLILGDIDGVPAKAIPDRARLLLDGTRQLCECKDDYAAFFKPKARNQRLLTMAAADKLGWEYVQIVPATLGSKTVQKNIDRIYGCRGVHVPMSVMTTAVTLLRNGPMTLGDFTAQLHTSTVNGFAYAAALMVRRVIEIDLSKPLAHGSIVRMAPPVPSNLPSISFRPATRH